MLYPRIIPCLLVKEGGLVKTRRFKDAVYIGDPINTVKIFNDKEADELIVMDISGSKNNSQPNYELLSNLASECFMPLTYVGAIKNIGQADKILGLGIEKIGVNSANLEDLNLLHEISTRFGKQSVVSCIDIKKNIFGQNKIYDHLNSKTLSNPIGRFVKDCIDAGAGEILLQSVDNDGVQKGLNLDLAHELGPEIDVPLIMLGGVGSIQDIEDGFLAGANAIGVGSFFTLFGQHRAVLITYPEFNTLKTIYNKISQFKNADNVENQ